MAESCIQQFFRKFLADIGVSALRIEIVVLRLEASLALFNKDRSSNTLTNIANELYQCLRPGVNSVTTMIATQIGSSLFYIVLLTVGFILLIVITLMVLIESKRYFWILFLSIYFALIYIALVYVVASNAQTSITNAITQADIDVTNCVNKAITELEAFLNQEISAINSALCFYASFPPLP